MDEDATWYGRRPQSRTHYVRRGPISPLRKGQQQSLFLVDVYCGHGRPSQLLLSSCTNGRPEMLCCARVKVSPHILALLFDLPSVLRDNSLSITEHFQTETQNASIRATTDIVRRRCGVSVILVKFDAVMQEKCPKLYDKYSAVAEMGDRLAKIDTGRKLGVGCCAAYRGNWVPI